MSIEISKLSTSPFCAGAGESYLAGAYDLNKQHGLLSNEEVTYAVCVTKRRHYDNVLQFVEVNFKEPSKEDLIESYLKKSPLPRTVQVISIILDLNETVIDTVVIPAVIPVSLDGKFIIDNNSTERDLNERTVVIKDVQPCLSPTEFEFVEELCRSYQPLRDAITARGLDPEGLRADAWCLGPEAGPTERVCWPSLFYCGTKKEEIGDLLYARPIEGIEMRISLTKKQVILFEDNSATNFTIPGSREGVDTKYITPENLRKNLKPIVISQPEGPSFKVSHNNTVEWQKWKFQVGFSSREGGTLHGVTYLGRPILHKFSFAEMVVPYGDPRPPHSMKNAFDAGEDGFGRNANSLVLGCDCLGLIHYFNANLVRDSGDAYVLKNAICLHEEDAGMGWKHTDWRNGEAVVKRNRRLVLSFVCTIANYDYGFSYELYLDGTIEAKVKLTGVLSTGGLSDEEQRGTGRKYGIKLGGSLYAPVHQHFFVARMDFVVDGFKNNIVEYNANSETEGPHNPTLNGFFFEETPLDSELEAIRDLSPETARFWKIKSTTTKNPTGGFTGYKIMPAPKCVPFAPLGTCPQLKRAQFLAHQLWVTPYDATENYPGGDFPNQNPGVDGLSVWTQKDRSIKDTDLVVWHVFGVTHLPRLEDWPIMPVENLSFMLKPSGFFDCNPAMDVPSGNGHHTVVNNLSDGSLSNTTKKCCQSDAATTECSSDGLNSVANSEVGSDEESHSDDADARE